MYSSGHRPVQNNKYACITKPLETSTTMKQLRNTIHLAFLNNNYNSKKYEKL